MMSAPKRSASEVIRDTEMILERVVAERERAAALLKYSNTLQQEAYDLAVSALGDEIGSNAYDLACTVLQIDPSDRTDVNSDVGNNISPSLIAESENKDFNHDLIPETKVDNGVVVPSEINKKVTNTGKKLTSKKTDTKKASDASKCLFYGIEVKRAKKIEAESVIELAKNTASKNQKSNPYESDRGRNSWRNHLFQAVLAAESNNYPIEEGEDEVLSIADELDSPLDEEIISPDVSDNEIKEDVSLNSDGVAPQSTEAKSDPFDDPVVKRTSNGRSTPFARSPVKFTPNSASPPKQEEPAIEDDVNDTDVGGSENDKIDIHVVKPVSGRVAAHGQSSPMPDGLAEEIRKRNSSSSPPVEPSKPVIPKIPKPSFLSKMSK